MAIRRRCEKCGAPFDLDADEIADGSYCPLCTECLRARFESNTPREAGFEERPIGELN